MKNLYFIFYKNEDYLSDRLLLLFNRIDCSKFGIWKFINIYDPRILNYIPIQLESLPAIYNVLQKELYLNDYVFEYVRSFDIDKYKRYVKQINEGINELDDTQKETRQTISEKMVDIQKPISDIYESTDVDIYNINRNQYESDKRMQNINGYDETENYNFTLSENNYNIEQTTIINDDERNNISREVQKSYEQAKNNRSQDIHKARHRRR